MHAAQREMFVALHSEHPCTEHVCTYTHFSSINFKPALKAAQAFVLPGTQATQSDAVHVRDVLELESAAQTTLRQRNTAKQEREKKNAFLLTLKTRDKKHRTITKKKKRNAETTKSKGSAAARAPLQKSRGCAKAETDRCFRWKVEAD